MQQALHHKGQNQRALPESYRNMFCIFAVRVVVLLNREGELSQKGKAHSGQQRFLTCDKTPFRYKRKATWVGKLWNSRYTVKADLI